MVRGLLIIFCYLWIGEVIIAWIEAPFPGSVLGMVLLTISLQIGLIRLHWVKHTADTLVKNMALLFVPPGVGIMLYFDLITNEWLPIATAVFISTFIVMAVTALVQQKLEK